MEDSDGIRDNEVTETQGESDYFEQDVGNIRTRKHHVTTSGNEEWQKQQSLHRQRREGLKPHERVGEMERAVKGFRIMSSGDGLIRGGFGKLPDGITNLMDQMKNLSDAMSKFSLTGDNLNVSGSFDKGYTVTRENPCEQQQANQTPM